MEKTEDEILSIMNHIMKLKWILNSVLLLGDIISSAFLLQILYPFAYLYLQYSYTSLHLQIWINNVEKLVLQCFHIMAQDYSNSCIYLEWLCTLKIYI